MQEIGRKNDRKDDKTRWELMPLDCLEDIARVYTEGAKKYGDNNWQNLENGYQRYKAALLRHLCEFEKGNEQYAYLVTWCVEQLDDYIQYRNKRKVK